MKFLITLGILSILSIAPAHAYLDPGSGSYIIQILAAALLSSLFIFKQYLKKIYYTIKSLFGKKTDSQDSTND